MKRLSAPYYLSAYGIARQNGFEGTEAEWLASLRGEAGPRGERGPQGVMGSTGPKGTAGKNGWTYVPRLDESGNLGWDTMRNTENLPDLIPVMNIRGPAGPQGPAYELNDDDRENIAEKVMEILQVQSPDGPEQSIEGRTLPADWAQNDEAASDHIKNRPFYTYEVRELALTEIILTEASAELGGFTLMGDTEYEVSFDGVSYVCTSVDLSSLGGIIYLGNDALIGNESSRTEPFCIVSPVGSEVSSLTVSDTAACSCTVSIVRRGVMKLHEKYLPYSPAQGDTLCWDGSFADKEVSVAPGTGGGQIFIRVSDAVLTEEELAGGVTIREYIHGSYVSTQVPGPLKYPDDGTLWLGMLLPTVAIVNTPSSDGDTMSPGIYFVITKAELGMGLMEFRACSLTVPGCGKFVSCPTVDAAAIPRYLNEMCLDRLIFRSPLGRLFSLSVSDGGETLFSAVGEG